MHANIIKEVTGCNAVGFRIVVVREKTDHLRMYVRNYGVGV